MNWSFSLGQCIVSDLGKDVMEGRNEGVVSIDISIHLICIASDRKNFYKNGFPLSKIMPET